MSNYRDDTMETAIASDYVWLNLGAIVEETAKASVLSLMILGSLTVEQAQASDSEIGSRGITIVESSVASDQFFLRNDAIQIIEEQANLKDSVFNRIEDTVFESARAEDIELSKIGSWIYEYATVQDNDLSNRTAYQVLYDTATVHDSAFSYALDQTSESALFTDNVWDQAAAHSLVVDSAQAQDDDLSSYVSLQYVTEQAQANDLTYGVLQAFTLNQDTAYADDEILLNTLSGQAWVSHSKTWAMSRYAPFDFDGLAVINGKVHLYNEHGVYVMHGSNENITGTIETSALDFGEQLTHPIAVYLEYQLSGPDKSLDIQVSTTQSGNVQTYQYVMPAEQADHLTNGRVLFGRGLRGRHFGFKINIHAQSAQINALSIEHVPTRRRI